MCIRGMPSNPLLRFRRSAAQLHALAEVERTIRATDTTCRRKYLRDFHDAFQDYSRVIEAEEVDDLLVQPYERYAPTRQPLG